ncbi:hypothetical protein [Haladaptatus paucihalophilus]|uniref:Uncharacterized protein n=1 Tax=Haladaptatus paucihalophilus DX253 TaxID=797209 RepID=A0A1M6ZL69_HALPU|nr:hypothetical protein [Haladaptatus paucihalophilus]SHL31160.1 hypothetical protein SAMN05444342_3484 [Haladaptatus paucihalophilus DX253]
MSQSLPEEWFIRDTRVNATIAWVLVVVFVAIAVVSFLNILFVEATMAAIAAFVAISPAVVYRSWTRTVPWPLLLVASLPLFVATARPVFLDDIVTGISVATLAMLVVVALELTTAVRMTPQFAVVFTVIVTLATAGFWAVGSAASATYLGTRFIETNTELMTIFTATFVAGIAAGVLFWLYFRRRLAANVERPRERGA